MKIKEKVVFDLGNYDNVQRVALAMALAGYYVRIRDEGTGYQVMVFTAE